MGEVAFRKKANGESVWFQQKTLLATLVSVGCSLCWWAYIEKEGLRILFSGEADCKSDIAGVACYRIQNPKLNRTGLQIPTNGDPLEKPCKAFEILCLRAKLISAFSIVYFPATISFE